MASDEPEALGFPNNYCDYTQTATQELFYERDDLEVFFGGAAGGGKSVALLMAALKYIRVPGYAALIIRKDLARMDLAGGLMGIARNWFGTIEGPRWVASRRTWLFPVAGDRPPSSLTFGYLSRPLDKYRYSSSEFQYIAFDELTDFTEEEYLFLFSRLRRNTSVKTPLRMRSASNPGGVGHWWVKERFIPDLVVGGIPRIDEQPTASALTVTANSDLPVAGDNRLRLPVPPPFYVKQQRIYVPSRISDNPHLDEEEYRQSLVHLPPVERERLMNGDWNVTERALIEAEWLRYFVETEDQVELCDRRGRSLATIPHGSLRRFATIDPAGTAAELTGEANGRNPSWSVIQIWDQPTRSDATQYLLLRHQVRQRVGFQALCALIREVHAEWEPEQIWIEGEKLGQAVQDSLKNELPIACVPTRGRCKVTRAGPLTVKMERGEIFFPSRNTTWVPKLEAEMLTWTGHERQPSDQIDAAAYAVIVTRRKRAGTIRVERGAVG